jgi:hypothetical protein
MTVGGDLLCQSTICNLGTPLRCEMSIVIECVNAPAAHSFISHCAPATHSTVTPHANTTSYQHNLAHNILPTQPRSKPLQAPPHKSRQTSFGRTQSLNSNVFVDVDHTPHDSHVRRGTTTTQAFCTAVGPRRATHPRGGRPPLSVNVNASSPVAHLAFARTEVASTSKS